MVFPSLMARIWAAALLGSFAGAGVAAQCTAESGQRRVGLLELYTSEGCDSCPPADRWVSALPRQGVGPDRLVTLGMHVDYWNYLGWKDPFARADFSARQRTVNRRNAARVIYTPQLMLNGKDYRRDTEPRAFVDRVDGINRQSPQAMIALRLGTEPGQLALEGTAEVPQATHRPDTAAFLALYENDLVSAVAAGENKGRQLRHDFVVRDLAGPYPLDARGRVRLQRRYRLDPAWKTGDLHVAAFVQNERSGDVLQALAIRYCK